MDIMCLLVMLKLQVDEGESEYMKWICETKQLSNNKLNWIQDNNNKGIKLKVTAVQ